MVKIASGSVIVIVGAGAFGVSTAYSLIKERPSAHVILIDEAREQGASFDPSKVVRADYGDKLYMKIALEALDLWRSDPLFRPFYHETGLVWVDSDDSLQRITENYQHFGAKKAYELMDSKDLKALPRIYQDANFTGVNKVFINHNGGWVEAADALKSVLQSAVDYGVEYREATVEAVLFDDEGNCVGVKTSLGETLNATHVVLAAGAAIPKLLADSAPEREEMQVGDRLRAAAICEATVQLSPEQAEDFHGGPVFVHEVAPTQGGVIPPNKDNQLKFWRDKSFVNPVNHPSDRLISMPPSGPQYGQWDLSPGMKEEMDAVREGIFGKAGANFTMSGYRICWDGITPDQGFIICPHPHSKNLFIAGGGSFHSFKFFSVLGEFVMQALEGEMDLDCEKAWAWYRSKGESAHHALQPTRKMNDI